MDYLNDGDSANTSADSEPAIDPARLQSVAERLAKWAATLPSEAIRDALP